MDNLAVLGKRTAAIGAAAAEVVAEEIMAICLRVMVATWTMTAELNVIRT